MQLLDDELSFKQFLLELKEACSIYDEVVLGVDLEGISKEYGLCLIQIQFEGKTYLVDTMAIEPFKLGLKEVFED